ncbi:MAG: C-GCAxxG-C-C family protein, partial [Megasphaera elsdenii]|nr:C-GCAxxG-C-C family protein [Megasphaera elsdenii]
MEREYKLAEQYHLQGNNCIESVIKTCNDTMNLQLPDVAIRMASGMGGGIGRSGCVCGALSGACLVIGALVGRRTPDEKPLPEVYKYTSEFHDRFKQHFGATCCRALNTLSFG